MRMLGDLKHRPKARFSGRRHIVPVPPNERDGYPTYALFHLTVWENIAFGLKRSDMPKDQIGDRKKNA
jgi:putrescine transport system ATP-binding protein